MGALQVQTVHIDAAAIGTGVLLYAAFVGGAANSSGFALHRSDVFELRDNIESRADHQHKQKG